MILERLQNKLHNEIPMTKLMDFTIKSLDDEFLITTAPIEININDKKTAFGGSLSTMTIISSWALVDLIVKDLGYSDSQIAIIKSESSFTAPVKNDIICKTYVPSKEEIDKLKEKLSTKKSGSIQIKSQVREFGKVCVNFDGVYVVKV